MIFTLQLAAASARSTGLSGTGLLIGAIVGGGIGAAIGSTKNRTGLGFVLGFLLGCIGWLIMAFVPRKSRYY